MGAEDTLNVTITADGSVASSALADVEARLTALEAAFGKAEPAAEGFGGALEELNGHVRVVTMGLGAMGLEADAAAVKMEALASIVKVAEESFGPLLLIAAGIAALGAAFTVFTDGVKIASAFQDQIATLSNAVRLSGGSWDEASEQVKKYLEIQEQATGYDQNEVLTALNALVVRGASLKDAYYEVAVAEDAAAATHKSLIDVVNMLTAAEGARATGLERLDPKLKDLIQHHADLFSILQQLESDMSGQAAASLDTYDGALRKLGADFDTLKRDVGDWLIPWLDAQAKAWDDVARSIDGVINKLEHHDFRPTFMDPQHGMEYMPPSTQSAQQQRQDMINRQTGLDRNPTVGGGAGAGSGYDPQEVDVTRDSTNYGDPTKVTAATSMMKAFADVEGELEAKMKGATSSAEEQTDKIQLLTQKYDDAQAEARALATFVDESKTAWQNQVTATEAAHAALNAAQVAEGAYEQSLKGTTHETAAQKDAQHELAAAVKTANDAFEAAHQKLGTLAQAYKALSDEQQQVHKAVIDTGADVAAVANQEAKADADYFAKAAMQQSEFMATWEKTNAQKVSIYDQMIGQLSTADTQYDEKLRDLTTKRTQAFDAALDDEAKAYKQWIDNATKETETFIDDVILKHESMRDELKNIFQQIEKNYVDSLSKMLIGTAGNQGPLAALFGSPTMPAGTSGLGGVAALGGGGTTRNGSSPSNAVYVIPADAETNYLMKTTGNATGVDPSSAMAAANGADTSNESWGSYGGGGGISASAVTGGISDVIGGAGVGTGLASLLTNGHTSSNGELGALVGGVGGAVGLALTGGLIAASGGALAPLAPLILAGSSAVGGLIGSLIGPQYSATTNPDMYNESSPAFGNYDQFLPNYQGSTATINGSQYTPQNQYWTANGGTSLQSQIANEIDTANMSSLTSAQQSILSQLQTLNGGTSGDGLNITAEHQGQFSLSSRQTVSVSQLESLVSQYQTAFGSSTSGSPIYSVGRSYPDFNIGTLQNTGASTPATGGTTQQVGNIQVIVQNPTIVGPSGLATVATSIGQAIYQAQQGNVIGSPATYRGIGPTIGNPSAAQA